MEFSFDVCDALPGRITVIEVKNSFSNVEISKLAANVDDSFSVVKEWVYVHSCNSPWDLKVKRRKEKLEIIIDTVGTASAMAQGLNSSITSLKKLISAGLQKIYIVRDVHESRCIIGMLKVGVKNLFVSDGEGAQLEVNPLCILDFYIHESKQRCGFGHDLFDIMLKVEKVHPVNLAVDRPSSKCIAFLKKHYNLGQHLLQSNNFIIYPGFLSGNQVSSRSNSNSTKTHNPSNTRESLSSVQVVVHDKDVKSKTFYSTVGNSLRWNCPEKPDGTVFNAAKPMSQESDVHNSRNNWEIHKASHSYASSSCGDSGSWNNVASNCSLTPVDNMTSRQRKWNYEMQSSWNIFGVKPLDYAYQNVSK